jgi:hypothetical protein
MPTPTYTALATVTLGSNSSSITFSNIPSTYRDLILVGNWQNSGNSSAGRLQLNGDTGSNYNGVWIAGNGSSISSGNESSQTSARIAGAIAGPVNTFSNSVVMDFLDYSATNKNKTVISRFDTASGESQLTASRWSSNSAISSIRFFDILGQTFQTGARFDLYGVVA